MGGAYCPLHARGSTTTGRGYGWQHQQRRAALLPFAIGQRCALCHQPMLATQQLDLDHPLPLRVYAGSLSDRIVHGRCNRGHTSGRKVSVPGSYSPKSRSKGNR